MKPNCHHCGKPIGARWATVTLGGFDSPALNGITFTVDAEHLNIQPPDRGIILPDRAGWVDELPEPELVTVTREGYDYEVTCREHAMVALKDNDEDAHLAAARHIARVHVEQPWPKAEARRA